nr:agmatine coumaroyltransferase-2-like [Ipomoea batatas]
MNVKIESSRIVKPFYEGNPPLTTSHVPLSVFDKVTFDAHIAIIYAYRPPTPPNSTILLGLRKALAVYREWAGRLEKDEKGNSIVLLNDKGVKFVEASSDTTLDKIMPFEPSASLLNLHPSLNGVVELIQVQLTRFKCGSLVIGFTSHHLIADGHSTSDFLIAWGKMCRGIMIQPLPLHDRTIFVPRNPPKIEYNHVGAEYMPKQIMKNDPFLNSNDMNFLEDIVVHKVHFTCEFLAKLKAKASAMNDGARPYSTFESLVAHLWRAITKARNLGGFEATHIRISVDGRARLNPKIPNEYFGNLVLWAFPTAKVKDLLREPLPYAAKLIHDAVSKVNNNYFRSFIDFANSKVVTEKDGLVPTADMDKHILCPNLEVDSWLRFPFYDLDFGTGCPYIFMPTFFPTEGMMFLLPSFIGDGSIDAFIPLFQDNLATFQHNSEELLEKIATNGTTWYSERSSQRLVGGFHDVDQISALSAKVDNMASMVQKIAQITLNNQNVSYASSTSIPPRQIMMCDLCGGEHNLGECLNDDMGSQSTMEQVDLSNLMGAANPQSFGNRGPPPGFQGQQNFRGGQQQQQSRQNLGFQNSNAQVAQPRQPLEKPPPPNWEAMIEMMFKSQMQSEEKIRQVSDKLDQLNTIDSCVRETLEESNWISNDPLGVDVDDTIEEEQIDEDTSSFDELFDENELLVQPSSPKLEVFGLGDQLANHNGDNHPKVELNLCPPN